MSNSNPPTPPTTPSNPPTPTPPNTPSNPPTPTPTPPNTPSNPPTPTPPTLSPEQVASALSVLIPPFLAVQQEVKRFMTQYVFVTTAGLYFSYSAENHFGARRVPNATEPVVQLYGLTMRTPGNVIVIALGLFLFTLHLRLAYAFVLSLQSTTAIRDLLLPCKENWVGKLEVKSLDTLMEAYRMATRDAYFADAILVNVGPDASKSYAKGWGRTAQRLIAFVMYAAMLTLLASGAHLAVRGATKIELFWGNALGAVIGIILTGVHFMFPVAIEKLRNQYTEEKDMGTLFYYSAWVLLVTVAAISLRTWWTTFRGTAFWGGP